MSIDSEDQRVEKPHDPEAQTDTNTNKRVI
jgi:hypothetical protein